MLEFFAVAGSVMVADVISPTPLPSGGGGIARASVNFKPHLELWLETLRDEYEREVARSPLERGVLMGEERFLDTCFKFSASDGLVVSGTNAAVGPLQLLDVDRRDFDIGGVTATASSARKSVRERAYEAVTRGNLLENRLATLLANRFRQPRQKTFSFDAAVISTLIETWSRLRADDPNNLGFDEAIKALHLDDRQRRLLESAGARDLRGIAEAIRSTPTIDRYNQDAAERRRVHKEEKRPSPAPAPVRWPISAKDAAAMRKAIAAGLERERSDAPAEPAPRSTRPR